MTSTASKVLTSCTCASRAKKQSKHTAMSFLGGIILALLPKCHVCILAYSTAISVCGRGTYYTHSPEWTSFISIGLACLTLLMVLVNPKGKRTEYAAIIIGIGIVLIGVSELYTGDMLLYYMGASVLILGVWINASFFYIYKKYLRPLFDFMKIRIGLHVK